MATSLRSDIRILLTVLAGLWQICIALPLAAHPVPISYADLTLEEGRISIDLTVHENDLVAATGIEEPHMLLDQGVLAQYRGQISDIFNQRLELSAQDGPVLPMTFTTIATVPGDADGLRLSFTTAGPPPAALVVDANLFPEDPTHRTFINIHEDGELVQQWLFDPSSEPRTHYAGTAAGVGAVLATFVPSGVEHVWMGPDHLLFLVGLILLGGTLRRLALIVTAFTIGHSVTLALAVLDVVSPPAHVIEPLIALSIVVVGADNLMRGQGRDWRPLFAGLFGLIHGFGFAFVLKEFGLPQANLAWSLLGFNLGVELGQLALVVPLALVLAQMRSRWPVVANRIVIGGSLAVILAGAYWFVDRVREMGSGI